MHKYGSCLKVVLNSMLSYTKFHGTQMYNKSYIVKDFNMLNGVWLAQAKQIWSVWFEPTKQTWL